MIPLLLWMLCTATRGVYQSCGGTVANRDRLNNSSHMASCAVENVPYIMLIIMTPLKGNWDGQGRVFYWIIHLIVALEST